MWHRVSWGSSGQAYGWDCWVMSPEGVEAPPDDFADLDALNLMGLAGWEGIHVESIHDLPPGVQNTRMGALRHQYLFKRPRDV